tara:strand:- start:469 stop:729 length:261 start_codon:yes stop_codon:yes gene_type:complete
MEVNQLILLVKKKIEEKILIQNIIIKDKTYLHEKHLSHKKGKFHLELRIQSKELLKYNKIEATKIIYKILDEVIKKYIHSIQILIS